MSDVFSPLGDARWQQEDPFKLTRRDGRLFGRGAADDKGAITAQLGPISAWLKTTGKLPVNVKMLVDWVQVWEKRAA